jgi:predicted AlkP superfamily phosphohydrolase/phosphomutase
MSDMRRPLYIIGIDSAAKWIIEELRDSGYRLKGFDGFEENGFLKEMESTLPPMTGPAWPSIYTGASPREHGIPDFFKVRKDYGKEVTFYDPSIKPPFWDVLADNGITSLLVTPAMALQLSKHKEVDMITGFPLPPRFGSEKLRIAAKKYGFEGEIEDIESGGERVGIEAKIKKGEITLAEASKEYRENIRKRAMLSLDLMKKKSYDLVFVCFTETDRMQHFSLNKKEWMSYVGPLYEAISDFMLEIQAIAKKREGSVILLSDHGAQPVKEKFLINAWLARNGYARLNKEITSESEEKGNVKYAIRERLMKSKLRSLYHKSPEHVKKVVRKVLQKGFSGGGGGEYTRIHDFDFDMKQTHAFASTAYGIMSMVFINDSRFEKGIIKAKEKKRLKAELKAELMKIRGSDGKQIIKEVIDAEPYYRSERFFIAPDLLVEAAKGYILDIFNYSNNTYFMTPEIAKSGDHEREGILGMLEFCGRRAKPRRKYVVEDVYGIVMDHFSL